MDRSHEYLDKIEQALERVNNAAAAAKINLQLKDEKITKLSAQLSQAYADAEGQRKVIEDLEATQARLHEANGDMRRQIDEANKTAEQFKTAAEQWKNRYWELRQPTAPRDTLNISLDAIYYKNIADRLKEQNRALSDLDKRRKTEIEHAETELAETKHELEATTTRNARLEQRLEAIRKAGEFAQLPF